MPMDRSYKDDNELDELLIRSTRYSICPECGGHLTYRGSGRYICEKCEFVVLDDFGKVKKYLEDNGPSNIIQISYATGLSRVAVTKLLKEGRLEVSRTSEVMPCCERCGVAIRFGRLCSKCEEEVGQERAAKKGVGVYNALAAERSDDDKMRFILKNKNKK